MSDSERTAENDRKARDTVLYDLGRQRIMGWGMLAHETEELNKAYQAWAKKQDSKSMPADELEVQQGMLELTAKARLGAKVALKEQRGGDFNPQALSSRFDEARLLGHIPYEFIGTARSMTTSETLLQRMAGMKPSPKVDKPQANGMREVIRYFRVAASMAADFDMVPQPVVAPRSETVMALVVDELKYISSAARATITSACRREKLEA